MLEPQDEQGKRRRLLLQTAFDVIAEVGFEGLRTRAVATRAGVNIATLHYYFPSKQELIEGLAQFIGAKFVTIHGPKPAPSGYPALDRLRQEFSDGRHYFKHEPKMLLVMQEFVMRGKRDREVQTVVEQMNFHWRQGIEQMVLEGMGDGTFRAEIEPEAMLAMLMSIFAGIAVAGGDRIREIERSTESWILSDKVKSKLKRQLRKRGAKA
ncbi:MAG TPA: TetR/AcrR family transcriptional regulator [Acidobacteriaceae bacterium]